MNHLVLHFTVDTQSKQAFPGMFAVGLLKVFLPIFPRF